MHKFVDHNQKDLFEVANYLKPWQIECPAESLVKAAGGERTSAQAALANLRKGYGLPLKALTVQVRIGGADVNQTAVMRAVMHFMKESLERALWKRYSAQHPTADDDDYEAVRAAMR